MNKIIYITGCDGSGKSTLANKISKITKGHILHCSYDKSWNVYQYHKDIIETAIKLSKYQVVILDRWAIDELVYGTVFRDGPSYDVHALLMEYMDKIEFVYCEPDNLLQNFERMKANRDEMYDSMEHVLHEYRYFIAKNDYIKTFNYNDNNTDNFIEELLK